MIFFLLFLQDYFSTSVKKLEFYLQTFGKATVKSGILGYGILEGLIRVLSYTVSGSVFLCWIS